jgi:hypothetical protein
MEVVEVKQVGTIKINSFRPLCLTNFGRINIEKYHLYPYIDSSCRREPDFENTYPSISALCRQGIFAPHLRKNDIVVYITVKRNYPIKELLFSEEHHKLVAILQVIDTFPSHEEGAEWYRNQGLIIPNNCMIPNNSHIEFDKTGGVFETQKKEKAFLELNESSQKSIGKKYAELWNKHYLDKVYNDDPKKRWGNFVITKPLFLEYNNPPAILQSDFERIMNKVPLTRTPSKISFETLVNLAKIGGIELRKI